MTEPGFAHPLSFPEGRSVVIRFPAFTARLTFLANDQLTVEIIDGDNAGFRDTVPYQVVLLRANLVVLSWQEGKNGSTVVHTLDLDIGRAYTIVAPAKGGLQRLACQIEQR